jgi:hypothetical protein
MSRGSIQRRGKQSWRIRIEDGVDAAGRRKRHTVTFKGKRQDAQRELTKLLAAADAGILPEPSRVTVAEHLRHWLDNDDELSPKTKERYRELAENQIIPTSATRCCNDLSRYRWRIGTRRSRNLEPKVGARCPRVPWATLTTCFTAPYR